MFCVFLRWWEGRYRRGDTVTAAHDQKLTIHLLAHVPEHSPREDDPHYHLFEAAKARLKRQGLWKCALNDDLCSGQPELHHMHVEFSQQNGADPQKVEAAFGLHFASDDDFAAWIESPGNLEVLCAAHHRTHYGVHVVPAALWETLRWHRAGQPAAVEFVAAKDVS
jgi:hypothetical protein